MIGEPMGGMENVEIPDDLPTMEIEDYSGEICVIVMLKICAYN